MEARLAVTVHLAGREGPVSVQATLRDPSGRQVGMKGTELEAEQLNSEAAAGGRYSANVRLKVRPWSAETPVLYELTVELRTGGAVVQSERLRVGFRDVAIQGGQVLVNGQPLRVCGVNRHEWQETRMKAITEEDMLQDLRILKR